MNDANRQALNNPKTGNTNSSAPINVGEIKVGGDMNGNIVVGNNNVICSPHTIHGDVINRYEEYVKPNRRDVKPSAPYKPEEIVGRDAELRELEHQIESGKAVLVHGHDGFGKTSLIKLAANSDPANTMTDGVLFIDGKSFEQGANLGFQDIVQQFFNALFESNPPLKVDIPTARTYLSNTAPLVILDHYDIQETYLDTLRDLFPKGAIITTSKTDLFSDTFSSLEVTPLNKEDAVNLLASKARIQVTPANSSLLSDICELLANIPLAITKTAQIIRKKNKSLEFIASSLKAFPPISDNQIEAAIDRSYQLIYSVLDDQERKSLTWVAAAPGLSVDKDLVVQQKTGESLESMELLQANSPRLRMAEVYKQAILADDREASNVDDSRKRWLYFLVGEDPKDGHYATILSDQDVKQAVLDKDINVQGLSDTDIRRFVFILTELDNIVGVTKWAMEAAENDTQQRENLWQSVIYLGRTADPYLTLHGLWDTRETILKLVEKAGQNLASKEGRAAEAWALHQLGSREAGVGSIATARKHLIHALRIRESLGDDIGAAYTRHNLNIIFTLKPPKRPKNSLVEKIISALKGLSGINRLTLIPFFLIIGAVIAALLLLPPSPKNPCPIPDDWQVYRVQQGDSLESISQRVAFAIDENLNEKGVPVIKAVIRNANTNCDDEGLPTEVPIEERYPIYVPVAPATTPTVIPTSPSGPSPEAVFDGSFHMGGNAQYDSVGKVINYSYTVTNTGRSPLEGPVTITDDRTVVTCPNVNTVGNKDKNLDPDESLTCTSAYAINQADLDACSVTNKATARVAGIDESAQLILTVNICQDMSVEITKLADPGFYHKVGQVITYTYTIRNTGNVPLGKVNFQVQDDHINDNRLFDCGTQPVDLALDASVSCSATYVITQADMDARSVANRAYVSVSAFGIAVWEKLTPATLTINYAPPPVLEKTADREIYNAVGQVITYTYVIKNTGTVPLPGPGTVDDDGIPVACEALNTVGNLDENLDPNETFSCTGTHTISQSDLDFGSVTNKAIAHVGGIDSNIATVTVKADRKPSLELTKSAEPATYDRVGQTITYTYVVRNSGNVTLTGQIEVMDDHINVDTRFSCGLGTNPLAPGVTVTCTNTYTISPADLDSRSVTNNATAFLGDLSSSSSATVSCQPAPAGWVVYTILRGDTLFNISTWYRGITADRLMQANCLSSDKIFPGQNIYVPGPPPLATITGFVQDSAGLRLSGITITLMNSNGIALATRTTNTNGEYLFSNLDAGIYKIFQVEINLRWGDQSQQNFVIIPGTQFIP